MVQTGRHLPVVFYRGSVWLIGHWSNQQQHHVSPAPANPVNAQMYGWGGYGNIQIYRWRVTWAQSNSGMGNVVVLDLCINPANTQQVVCSHFSRYYKTSNGGKLAGQLRNVIGGDPGFSRSQNRETPEILLPQAIRGSIVLPISKHLDNIWSWSHRFHLHFLGRLWPLQPATVMLYMPVGTTHLVPHQCFFLYYSTDGA